MDAAKVPSYRLTSAKAFTEPTVFWIVALVLLGLALRAVPLHGNPLHQDEALYGFWGRLIGTTRDLWLTTVPVDKPPLTPYLIAGSQAAFGVNEFTLRMPALAASLLSIPLAFVLARRLYSDQVTGVVAAATMALTPFPVLFGATAFTDPILVCWWLVACYAAASGRWGWSGILLGLAFATKQQATLLMPLVLALGIIRRQGIDAPWPTQAVRFVLALVLVIGGVFAWDAFRRAGGAATGFWGQGVDSYGGLRLIWSSELLPRLREWSRLGGYLLGWPLTGILFLLGLGGLIWHDLTQKPRTRAALADLTLIAFASFYLVLQWILAFPVWDRYLLPIVPIVGLLLGRVAALVVRAADSRREERLDTSRRLWLALPILLVVLIGTGLTAVSDRIPIGGDHGAYDGLTEVMRYLRALPAGTVLYDRWLTWHYDYYLFDSYLYRAGFPSADWLANDAAAFFDGRPRYLVLPDWESSARLRRAFAEVDLAMAPVLATQRRDGTDSFIVYQIGPRDNATR